jgi:addiction module HigA family antidote
MHVGQRQSAGDLERHLLVRARIKVDQQKLFFVLDKFDVECLAKELGVSRPTVNQLVTRRRSVTAEMALRLARYFGTSAQVWQNLQAQYDLEVATAKIGKAVKQKIRPRLAPEPTQRSAAV